jgi:hypothetical protein
MVSSALGKSLPMLFTHAHAPGQGRVWYRPRLTRIRLPNKNNKRCSSCRLTHGQRADDRLGRFAPYHDVLPHERDHKPPWARNLQPNARGVIGCDWLRPIVVQLPTDRLRIWQSNMTSIWGRKRSEQGVLSPWRVNVAGYEVDPCGCQSEHAAPRLETRLGVRLRLQSVDKHFIETSSRFPRLQGFPPLLE